MIIALIGFGKVSQNLVDLIQADDIEFITSTENRSQKTIEQIKKSKIKTETTIKKAIQKADIIISATSPKTALEVSENATNTKAIYLDLNNISPKTTLKISKNITNYVDGAIIGKIDSKNPTLYLSGPDADKLQFLNNYITTKIISDRIGDASILKLLRSTYTKTLSALLIEANEIASQYDLKDEFYTTLTLTEGEDFKEKSQSRIINTLNNSKRKSEELEEIIDYFDNDLIMVKAALKKLNQ
ncbi:MAG: NAD(P)-dependent oxidoreductase [Methanobrevibacter thaueri]|nr:NAD(P)-dependent oxidoreductase [Methanobrevibacter thaueri]